MLEEHYRARGWDVEEVYRQRRRSEQYDFDWFYDAIYWSFWI
jgi:hypothetical protein